jgi:hypothetical protein
MRLLLDIHERFLCVLGYSFGSDGIIKSGGGKNPPFIAKNYTLIAAFCFYDVAAVKTRH